MPTIPSIQCVCVCLFFAGGIAEVEVYSHKRPTPPILKAVSGKSLKTSAKLSWTNPNNLKVRVVRQTLVGAGSLMNYPTDPRQGVQVYEGKGTSVEDKDLPTDVQQFYSAYAFHPETGWSALHWDCVDTVLIGDPNPNIALEKKATSSTTQQVQHIELLMVRTETAIYTRIQVTK